MDSFSAARPLPRAHVFGVDFSGGVDAGRKIWIARAEPLGDCLRVDQIMPASSLPGGGVSRGAALAALATLIRASGACVFGFDFPFSLPRPLMTRPTWTDFARQFADDYPTADGFRDHCRKQTGGQELKRRTDVEARTPFCAYNLRVYRQTYYGIRDLLAPLAVEGGACVPPLQPPVNGVAWLLEICPATTLKRMGLYRPYKGASPMHRAQRQAILDVLRSSGLRLAVMPSVLSHVLDNAEGDALDSLIAAWATWRALEATPSFAAADELDALEGRVYG